MAPKKKFMGEAHEMGLDIVDVYKIWDADCGIRDRLRDGQGFMHPESGLVCDIRVCVLNGNILQPMLEGMANLPDRKLPGVGDLRNEMSVCYRVNKRTGKEVDEAVIAEAMHVRKLLSFVKSKTRRKEVSWEP